MLGKMNRMWKKVKRGMFKESLMWLNYQYEVELERLGWGGRQQLDYLEFCEYNRELMKNQRMV